jgi:hypothetical protein
MHTLTNKVDTLGHALIVQSLKFRHIFNCELVTFDNLFHGDFPLVEASNNINAFAHMSPFGIRENSVEEGRGETDDVE